MLSQCTTNILGFFQDATQACSAVTRSKTNVPPSILSIPDIPQPVMPFSWNAIHDSYDYTRARFLVNEKHEMAIRRVKFNMSELAKRAAESVGFSHDQCVNIGRLPDGMFNRAFLFTIQDGTQVVGKVPNPNAGRPHNTTASEVATMDFVCNLYSLLLSKGVSNAPV